MSGSGTEEKIQFDPDSIVHHDRFSGSEDYFGYGLPVLRHFDERCSILGPVESELERTRSWVRSNPSQLQMVRLTSVMEKAIDGVAEGEVRSETG